MEEEGGPEVEHEFVIRVWAEGKPEESFQSATDFLGVLMESSAADPEGPTVTAVRYETAEGDFLSLYRP